MVPVHHSQQWKSTGQKGRGREGGARTGLEQTGRCCRNVWHPAPEGECEAEEGGVRKASESSTANTLKQNVFVQIRPRFRSVCVQ